MVGIPTFTGIHTQCEATVKAKWPGDARLVPLEDFPQLAAPSLLNCSVYLDMQMGL